MAYANRPFPAYDPASLTDIATATLAAAAPARAWFRRARPVPPIRVRFEPIPPGLVRLLYGADGTVTFAVPECYASPERRDFFTNAWMACAPLLAGAKAACPALIGEGELWVDDIPAGPGLAFCGQDASHVLIPDPRYLESDGYAELRTICRTQPIAWPSRENRILWRGATSGIRQVLHVERLEDMPRIALALRAQAFARPEVLDVKISQLVQLWNAEEEAHVTVLGVVGRPVPLLQFRRCKGAIDVDGNSSSWAGLFTKLVMGSVVFKVASRVGFRQWYYDRLVPWKNFVPLSASLEDLGEAVEWFLRCDAEAERIGARGAELAAALSYDAVMAEATARVVDYVSRGALAVNGGRGPGVR